MKKIYCTKCGKLNDYDEDHIYCYNCGKRLVCYDNKDNDNDSNESSNESFNESSNELTKSIKSEESNDKEILANKYMDSKGSLIAAYIIIPVLTIALLVAISLIFDNMYITILITFISVLLSALFDYLIYASYQKDITYPNDCILYNKEKDTLEVYTRKGFVNVNVNDIKKIVVEDYIYVSTGKAVIPIKVKYGTITFKLNDKTKVRSITVQEVRQVKSMIDNIITYR